jgi:uncharacterized protein (TIGR03437 family)
MARHRSFRGLGFAGNTAMRIAAAVCVLAAAAPAWSAIAVHSPYLQNVRSNRATVVWSTRENIPGTVEYSTDQKFNLSAPSRIRAFPSSQTALGQTFYQHQVELTGLTPGTEYFYRVIMSDGTNLSTETDHRFRTAGPGKMMFLVFGDSGAGSPAQQEMAQALLKERPNFILHVGDMAYEEGTYDQFQANYFEYYKTIMWRAPVFPAPGNHEYYTDRASPYMNLHSVPTESVAEIDQGRYYSFDWGPVHFISLDSNLLDNGFTAARMLTWLEQDLEKTTAPWKVAYFHHLPYPLDHHLDDPACSGSRRMLVPVLERHNVQLVFSGHEHIYERTKPLRNDTPVAAGPGTVYVTTGGAGGAGHTVRPRDFVAKSVAAYHYLRVEADESRITINAVDGTGQTFDTAVLSTPSFGNQLFFSNSSPVVNGASFAPSLAAGGIVTIFGKGLSTETAIAPGAPLPAVLGGTNITVNGQELPLYFVSPNQVNAQLRMDQQGPAVLRVITAGGSTQIQVNIAESAPGIFGGGIQHANGSSVSASFPAKVGETVVIYASSLGPVDSKLEAGQPSPRSPLARVTIPVTAEVGGISVVPDFAGLAPDFVGLYQVNVKVPPVLLPGVYPVRLLTHGNISNAVNIDVVQ